MYEYKAEVLRVVDGDTVDCRIDLGFDTFVKKRVRLLGIDAPETRTRDLEEKALGFAASAGLKNLLASSSDIVVMTFLDRGKFGRVLGVFLVGEERINANEYLVENGLAKVYDGGKR